MTFLLSSNNPNEGIGGGGCLCSPLKHPDAQGPFVVFPATETDSNLSPHAVMCAPCAKACALLVKQGEPLNAGERG